jgi:predicted lipoprotein with Yx(FWY)xxD motif
MLTDRIGNARGRALVPAVVAVAIAVGGSGISQAAPAGSARVGAMPVAAKAKLTLRRSEYGKVIFDAHRRVLYLFAADRGRSSTCYGACAKAWPPLLTKRAPTAGPGLEPSLLGTTRRRDGSLQVTYGGHPLYYFEEDMRSKIMCQHADMHGGFWYVVNADGSANKAKSKTKM